jgi:hypothetical protein
MLNKLLLINFILLINISLSNALNLCTYSAYSKYTQLLPKYPELSKEFNKLSQIPLPLWYTDRDSNSLNIIKDNLDNCNDLLSVIIIYGLPNKDCEAGQSAAGSNKNSDDYKNFLDNLNNLIKDKEVIYIIEPDSLNFLLPNKCGHQNNYKNNLKLAVDTLSQNINAQIYLDVGYWNIIYSDDIIKNILDIVYELDSNNRVKGFSLNLANYRKNDEMIKGCERVNSLSKKKYQCIIDTSRNYNGPSSDNQWCNLISAGFGKLPTKNTNNNLIDYYLWLKPQSELDGNCIGFSNSYQTSKNAGDLDIDYFKILWNQGIFHNELSNCF